MVRTYLGCSMVAAAALLAGVPESDAQVNICGGVMDSNGDHVMGSAGGAVLDSTTFPCEDEVALVETTRSVGDTDDAGDTVAAEPLDTLPNDGIVYFDLDSADLDDDQSSTLQDIVTSVMAQEPKGSVTVRGYADRSGPADYNLQLSERRAEAVASALQEAGVPEESIATMAKGETDLAVPTDDGVPMQENRRAAVLVRP